MSHTKQPRKRRLTATRHPAMYPRPGTWTTTAEYVAIFCRYNGLIHEQKK